VKTIHPDALLSLSEMLVHALPETALKAPEIPRFHASLF